MLRRALAVALLALAGSSSAAFAGDTLLIERVQDTAHQAVPLRGWTSAQVQERFGTPQERLDPRGGQKRQWPVIHRWVYPAFTVYFERDRVIDVVANRASANEIGPKPAIR